MAVAAGHAEFTGVGSRAKESADARSKVIPGRAEVGEVLSDHLIRRTAKKRCGHFIGGEDGAVIAEQQHGIGTEFERGVRVEWMQFVHGPSLSVRAAVHRRDAVPGGRTG